MICEHRFRNTMPVGGIQWCICRPADGIGVSSAVLESEDWAMSSAVKGGEGVDVAVEGVGIVDAEVASVNLVHAVAGVEVGERRDGWADPTNC